MSFELLCLVVLAYLVFGPRKLPELARFFAKTMAEIRRAGNEFRYSLEDEVRKIELEVKQPAARLPAAGVDGAVARPDAAVPAGATPEAALPLQGENAGPAIAEDEEQWYESDWEPDADEDGEDVVESETAAVSEPPAPPAKTEDAHEVPHEVRP